MIATAFNSLHATAAISEDARAHIRRHMVLHGCKWDPQVGDNSTLAPFALVLPDNQWRQLATWAESLAHETLTAEEEILHRPELWKILAIPRRLRRLMRHSQRQPITPAAARVMRFDFHPTTEGWQISEVNSDVPGGFTESSTLPRLMRDALADGNLTLAGNPTDAWASAMLRHSGSNLIGLICAPGFMEDRQIVCHLAQALIARGGRAAVLDLQQLQLDNGHYIRSSDGQRLGALVRFYQAEWLAQLPRRFPWQPMFLGGKTPVSNPPTAIFSESKAFPLVWDQLHTQLPTWRALLPETRSIRRVALHNDWVLKEVFCNNGDSVIIAGETDSRTWRRIRREIWWHPDTWIAQRRFTTQRVETPLGEKVPCIGVYVIDGKAAGIYGRISRGTVVDYSALDVAVLIEREFP